jgi:adenine C2-methylase RlmN of 23S rRNA A2503 and tRNA A37
MELQLPIIIKKMSKRQITVEVDTDDTDDVILKKVKHQVIDLRYLENCVKEFSKTVDKIEDDYTMFKKINEKSAVNLFMSHILPIAKNIVKDNDAARDEIEKEFKKYPKHYQRFIEEDYDAYGEFLNKQDIQGACEEIWNAIKIEIRNKKL